MPDWDYVAASLRNHVRLGGMLDADSVRSAVTEDAPTPTVTGAERLLEAATPLPWESLPVYGHDVEYTDEDRDLILHAVNNLSQYEDALDWLELMLNEFVLEKDQIDESVKAARALLDRLRP